MPIRLIVGVLKLKSLVQSWRRKDTVCPGKQPYFQYFCGGLFFEHKFPCDPSDFVHFRKRIGEAGVEKIFAYSIKLHGKTVKK
jgi:IS5 family transposase